MEHADRDSVGKLLAEHYRRVRIVLDAPVDELLREDLPEVEEGTHVRNMRPSGSECADNCLAVYRQAHHLTLREEAAMLGVSHESVRLACGSGRPRPHTSPGWPHWKISRKRNFMRSIERRRRKRGGTPL